jgi:hypothetical protein
MQKATQLLLITTFGLTLAGCGGGGGDSGTTSTSVVPTNNVVTKPVVVETKFNPVVGVYDATFNNDKFVMLIDQAGKVSVFNDLNDAVGINRACYRAPTATEVNASFDQQQLSYDENKRHFTLKTSAGHAAWEVDANNKISFVILDGMLTSATSIRVSSLNGGHPIVLTTKALDLTADTVTANLCKK